jgi:hypothetical protein
MAAPKQQQGPDNTAVCDALSSLLRAARMPGVAFTRAEVGTF